MDNASSGGRGKSGSNWNNQYDIKKIKENCTLLIDRMYMHCIFHEDTFEKNSKSPYIIMTTH